MAEITGKPAPSVQARLIADVRRLPLNDAVRLLRPLSLLTLLQLLIAMLKTDETRMRQLVARGDVTHLLDEKLRNPGNKPPEQAFAHENDSLATISAEIIANLNRTGVTYVHSLITERLARLLRPDRQLAFYETLLGLIDNEPYKSRIRRTGGLYYLYIDASKVAFEARQPERAFELCVAAKGLASFLPDNELSAKARFAGQVSYISFLAHIDNDRIEKLLADAQADLQRELENALRFEPADWRLLVLRAALSRSNLWQAADGRHLTGRITAAEARIEILEQSLADAYGLSSADGRIDAERLRSLSARPAGEESRAIGRTLIDLAQSYARMGDDSKASWYVSESHHHDLSARSRLDADIAVARATTDVSVLVRICEDFIRAHVLGTLGSLGKHQHIRALRHYASLSTRLANLLRYNNDHAAAAFWRQQGKYWSTEARHHDAVWDGSAGPQEYFEQMLGKQQRAKDTKAAPPTANYRTRNRERQRLRARRRGGKSAEIPAEHARFLRDGASRQLTAITRYLATEDVSGMIDVLADVGRSPNLVLDDELERAIQEAIAAVVSWRPELFAEQAAPDSVSRLTGSPLLTEVLRVTVGLARGFAPSRLVPLLLRLSQQPEYDLPAQLELVTEALEIARAQGRSTLQLRSLRIRLCLLDDLARPASDKEIADELADVVRGSGESTAFLGISGLVDRAFGLSSELADLAEMLAETGRPELAFQVSALGQGQVTRTLAQNPDAVAELDNAIKARRSDDDVDLNRLYFSVLSRICAQPAQAVSTKQLIATRAEYEYQDGEAVVRFIRPTSNQVRAIGRTADSSYFATSLGITPSGLSDLADAIWFWLRTRTHVTERDVILTRLYDACIAPLRPYLRGATRLTFAFHDGLPFLPLHGAKGPDGFVGAQAAVSYETATSPMRRWEEGETARGAAVLGWDRSTLSDQETTEVTAVLESRFDILELDSARSAVSGVILNPEQELAILHLAGHGHLLRYPDAMDSSVELAADVTLQALDLLRSGCRSRFVFLNVCSIGYQEVTAGDQYGFALAATSRGAFAFLAPVTYVSPADAKNFAARFYEKAAQHDAAEAIRIVISDLAGSGAGPETWLPYPLFGYLPPLSSFGREPILGSGAHPDSRPFRRHADTDRGRPPA